MGMIGNSLSQGLVSGANILDGTVDTADLKDLAVTPAKLTTVTAAKGGTGRDTLTANNLLVGNGVNAVSLLAPGANGTVLTSNGTSWVASLPSGGSSLTGVTSVVNTSLQVHGNTQLGMGHSFGTSGVYRMVAIGANISANDASHSSVIAGANASLGSSSSNAVLIGQAASISYSSIDSVAIGNGISIGNNSNQNVVIGTNAKVESYDFGNVVIGSRAWSSGNYTVRIGTNNQNWQYGLSGSGSIGIGYNIGDNGYNIIALHSDINTQFDPQSSGFYVSNVTLETTTNVLYFNPTTKKISYGAAPSGGGSNLDTLTYVLNPTPSAAQNLSVNGSDCVNAAAPSGGTSGGGSSPPPGPAYIPDWYRVQMANGGAIAPPTPVTSPIFGAWNGSSIMLPAAWSTGNKPFNYKLMGVGSSRAPWQSENFYWNMSGMTVDSNLSNTFLKFFAYNGNPAWVPGNGSELFYGGWDSNVGTVMTFLVPGSANNLYRQDGFPNLNDNYIWRSHTWNTTTLILGNSQMSAPPSVQRYRLVIVVTDVSQSYRITVTIPETSAPPTLFDQFIYNCPNSGRTIYYGFLTVNDPTMAMYIREGGLTLQATQPNTLCDLVGWFEA